MYLKKSFQSIKDSCNRLTKVELLVYTLAIIAMIAALWSFLPQGITLNDELQNRFDRKIGFWYFVQQYVMVHFANGRVLSLPADYRFLGFIFENMFLNRCVCALLIALNAAMIFAVLYKLCRDKNFALFTGFIFVMFMPLTIQHAAPAAFTPIVTPPVFFLGFSLLFFMDCLEKSPKCKHSAFISSLFLFMAEIGYEFMITYTLLFPLIYIYRCIERNDKIKFFEMVKACKWQIIISLLFLALYFGLAILYPTNYSGNQIGFVSLKSSLNIIKILFMSAIPGYYYLLNDASTFHIFVLNRGLLNENTLFTLGMFLIVVGTIAATLYFTRGKQQRKNLFISICGILVSLMYMILPSIPNAISSLYQTTVSETFFTSLPVSYYLYIAAVIAISQGIWLALRILRKFQPLISILMCVCVLCVTITQQSYNTIISKEQTKDYKRLEMIEDSFETEIFRSLNNMSIYSPNIYETQNLLAIHDGYWERLAGLIGLNISFVEEDEKASAQAVLEVRDNGILIWDETTDTTHIISTEYLSGAYYAESPDGTLCKLDYGNPGLDGDFVIYSMPWSH